VLELELGHACIHDHDKLLVLVVLPVVGMHVLIRIQHTFTTIQQASVCVHSLGAIEADRGTVCATQALCAYH
jgi:hypothetical protein